MSERRACEERDTNVTYRKSNLYSTDMLVFKILLAAGTYPQLLDERTRGLTMRKNMNEQTRSATVEAAAILLEWKAMVTWIVPASWTDWDLNVAHEVEGKSGVDSCQQKMRSRVEVAWKSWISQREDHRHYITVRANRHGAGPTSLPSAFADSMWEL